jgi:hypothetical protein
MQVCCYDVQCTKALVHLMHLCGVDDCYTTCRYRSSTVLLMRKRDNHQSFGPTCNAGQLGQPTMFNVRRGGGFAIAPFYVQLDEPILILRRSAAELYRRCCANFQGAPLRISHLGQYRFFGFFRSDTRGNWTRDRVVAWLSETASDSWAMVRVYCELLETHATKWV